MLVLDYTPSLRLEKIISSEVNLQMRGHAFPGETRGYMYVLSISLQRAGFTCEKRRDLWVFELTCTQYM